jgi:hypothetical protein
VVKRRFLSVLLFGQYGAPDLDLSRFVVDDNVVRVGDRIGPINTLAIIGNEANGPTLLVFDSSVEKLRACSTAVCLSGEYSMAGFVAPQAVFGLSDEANRSASDPSPQDRA